MPLLSFTLKPEQIARLNDVIVCLSKFSDTIGWEVDEKGLSLSALEAANSAHAVITLEKESFFLSFCFMTDFFGKSLGKEEKFSCQFQSKALLSVFRGRASAADGREKEGTVEKCNVSIQDQANKAECRLVVKMICKHGVIKTYKLTYEPSEVSKVLFDTSTAKNKWTIGANILRSFCEYFGPKTEQLDISHQGGHASFTSYAEKIMAQDQILKQPLQTSISVDIADFETFEVEENLHVAINVKDFKAAIAHADSLKVAVSARYSWPKSPMQLQYFSRGFSSTFTFMTIDGNRGGSGNATSGARLPTANRAKTASRPSTAKGLAVERPPRTREASEMPPPPQRLPVRSFAQDSNTQQSARPSPPPPRASIDHDSLFLPQEDREERIWAEKDPDAEDDELGWDASEDHDAFASTIQRPRPTVSGSSKRPAEPDDVVDDLRIAPSQRVSQVPGLFDD